MDSRFSLGLVRRLTHSVPHEGRGGERRAPNVYEVGTLRRNRVEKGRRARGPHFTPHLSRRSQGTNKMEWRVLWWNGTSLKRNEIESVQPTTHPQLLEAVCSFYGLKICCCCSARLITSIDLRPLLSGSRRYQRSNSRLGTILTFHGGCEPARLWPTGDDKFDCVSSTRNSETTESILITQIRLLTDVPTCKEQRRTIHLPQNGQNQLAARACADARYSFIWLHAVWFIRANVKLA